MKADDAPYTPNPIHTGNVALEGLPWDLIEKLARNVHENWAKTRMASGWRHGPSRDDLKKENPCLVPYESLPENEKVYDRDSVIETVKCILALGYRISPPSKPAEPRDSGVLENLLCAMSDEAPMNLTELQAIWTARDRKEWGLHPEIYRDLGERLVKKSESILAYDILTEGLESYPAEVDPRLLDESSRRIFVRLRQLLGRTLAQSGLTVKANAIFSELLAQGQDDAETMGMLARTCKDLGRRALSPEKRLDYFDRARVIYQEAYEAARQLEDLDGALYNGVNAASLSMLCDRRDTALALAKVVEEICGEKIRRQASSGVPADYWVEASLGEAALIQGRLDSAADHYARAALSADENYGDILAMQRQCRLLLAFLTGDVHRLDANFKFPKIALFTGSCPGSFAAPEDESRYAAMHELLSRSSRWIGYACLYSPAAIVFFEAMRRNGWEYHVVLASDPEQPRQMVKNWPNAEAWAGRLENVLNGASQIHRIGRDGSLDAGACWKFAEMYLEGLVVLKQGSLETEIIRMAAGPDTERADAKPQENVETPDFSLSIHAILFADVQSYSKLSERQMGLFARHYLDHVAMVIQRHQECLLSIKTAGDGLFCVFKEVDVALAFALDLRDILDSTDWEQYGLPSGIGIRISLDAGPIYGYTNPVTQDWDFFGSSIIRAARIEPITPPGQVFVTEVLAALAARRRVKGVMFEYVGRIPLAKNYTTIPLYHVTRVNE